MKREKQVYPIIIPLLLVLALAVGVLAVSCSKQESLVSLAETAVSKTVNIQVSGFREQTVTSFTKKGLKSETKLVPVTVTGAGVLISPNNHVLTCAHLFWLVKISGMTVCMEDDYCTSAELLAKEDRLDLALIQTYFDYPTPYAKVANPKKLKVGQEVLAVGSPLGFAFSVSHGIISALYRNEVGLYNMTQSDAFLNPGNSGGPLFNRFGELVGINSQIVPPVNAPIFTGLGFSVQCGQIIEFITRVKNKYKGLGRGINYERV